MKDASRVEFHVRTVESQTDARQSSGRLTPVFPSLLQGSAKEEEYIARMIARDRAYDRNWR